MKPEIQKKWTEALESGEYRQTKNVLTRRHKNGQKSFCCLGVLCDLAVKEKVIPSPTPVQEMVGWKFVDVLRYAFAPFLLPQEVMDWAGITTSDGYFSDGSETLTTLNDNGVRFKTIAKQIKKRGIK